MKVAHLVEILMRLGYTRLELHAGGKDGRVEWKFIYDSPTTGGMETGRDPVTLLTKRILQHVWHHTEQIAVPKKKGK